MHRSARWIAAALFVAAFAGSPQRAVADKSWCGLYCDAVYGACKASVGLWDRPTCDSFHDGCLDGCEVNENK